LASGDRDTLTAEDQTVSFEPRGRVPIDPDCAIFAIPVGVISGMGYVWGLPWIWIPGLILLFCIVAFFRDPPRRGSQIKGALRSPADGKVVAVVPNEDPNRGPVPGTQIAIYLSVFNVHINRSPCEGVIQRIRYEPGKFHDVRDSRTEMENESNWIFMKAGRHDITVRQIAGLVARRIVCRVREGQKVYRGQRIGLIRFGSRTELYVPAEAKILVREGQNVKGAQTDLAVLPE
jgi:phosphatidylserine decarboxylase